MGRKKQRRKVSRPPPAPAAPAPDAQAPPFHRKILLLGGIVLACIVIASIIVPLVRHRGAAPASPGGAAEAIPIVEPEQQAFAAYAGSESCRQCHAAVFKDWSGSHHALAERAIDDRDKQALDSKPEDFTAQRVIGEDPLRQYLVDFGHGRLQATEQAFDPHKHEWFDVFGDEHREKGEWGHWTGRGMNWNSMCAACHNTRLRKNYDAADDSYHTSRVEMGIGCESCHGPMKSHVDWQRQHPWLDDQHKQKRPTDPTLASAPGREASFQTCGTCHARRGELTGDFKPGERFDDHYRLSVVDETDVYYPDGQVREEDYEYAAFLGSRMHAAGVRCVDCHNPHTAKVIAQGDFLCMRCHQGNNTSYPTAPLIKPVEHVFHKPESAGARCINCHMPQTTYMQRHVRHDHGFTIPDPLLTRELGIPNACNRCHTDKDADWSQAAVEKWYGSRMERYTRKRARWIAAARKGDPAASPPLIDLLNDAKETPYWKAVASGLLARWVSQPEVTAALLQQVKHESPLVRAMAARSLEPVMAARPDVHEAMKNLLDDPSRSVRLAAAWTLRAEIDPGSPAGRELTHLMSINADQPIGRLQRAHYELARQNPAAAVEQVAKAVEWDPKSAAMRQEMAIILSMTGQTRQAIEQLEEACRLAPREAEYRYLLGLAWSEAGDLSRTVDALQQAVQLDPRHAGAWYNLGLARQSLGQSDAALDALSRAESADGGDPRIPYARATIFYQLGRRDEAVAAARKALEIQPGYQPAIQLLMASGQAQSQAPPRR